MRMLPAKDGYMNKKLSSSNAGVAKQWFNGCNKFAEKGEFIKLLHANPFHGFTSEDADKHMERTLEIAELHKTKNMTYNQFMLRVFPNSLAGDAMDWVNFELSDHVGSWIELKVKFLEKFSPRFTWWMDSKFDCPDKMNPSLKNELWDYWRKVDDRDDTEDEESELLRIETNLFDYETPLCIKFNEFNYLLKIDTRY